MSDRRSKFKEKKKRKYWVTIYDSSFKEIIKVDNVEKLDADSGMIAFRDPTDGLWVAYGGFKYIVLQKPEPKED